MLGWEFRLVFLFLFRIYWFLEGGIWIFWRLLRRRWSAGLRGNLLWRSIRLRDFLSCRRLLLCLYYFKRTVFVLQKLGVSSDLPENLFLIHCHISLCEESVQLGQSHWYGGLNNARNTWDRMIFRREQYPFYIFYSTSLIFPANFSTISLNAFTISRLEVSSDLRYSESPLNYEES
jgi:hypothetical protein